MKMCRIHDPYKLIKIILNNNNSLLIKFVMNKGIQKLAASNSFKADENMNYL